MLDYRPLTLRSEKARAIFRIEAEFCAGFREFLGSQRFVEIHSPKIVSTGTEGGANLFVIDYFGKRAYLAQSPQFYKQIMVGAFERVFEIGPVYRAEQHDTTRHLNEYISMDFEIGFVESEQDLIQMQTRLLSHMFARVKENCARELALFNAQVPQFTQIAQMKLSEAIDLLRSKLKWSGESGDLDPEAERLLCQHFAKETGCDLVYITHYPLSVRPFYAMPAPAEADGVELSRSFDLLFRGLEVTTGGQRIHEFDELTARMRSRDLEPEQFNDYLQCFRYGMPPHGGLAIGLERLAKQLLGLATVKLASLFPRDINRLTP
jgi:nondiscriminating aspartyl-tRNA synthetase